MSSVLITLPDVSSTQYLGQTLGHYLSEGTVILLEGNLGAGKTTLVQGIGQGLGIKDAIVSPTFTIVNEYLEGRLPLYHLDLYRLEPSEIQGLYLDRYWDSNEVTPGITAIEWGQRLPYNPSDYLDLRLIYDEGQGRQAIVQTQGNFELDQKIWSMLQGTSKQ
ncbi:tRNA (adenosine(37)-N6)-threonylcarbamoyltransferase complex ATPase subunit type 1 TsaE [Aphanothece sacrum]|uniref:tRNA threonylcarbamoyladenosine biosynthesis protein TsaE n=1 Tax=Aphanothece sacrum FPU1 TaxID=1920663 RepID=A0A401ICZ3_APHSA|nr:tRNA (adenosine(37)-N6)-threonylcarbamoyltransferase complex ATPase subunit type 1 TsaE [Aphanothece sacrum]GBF79173.1 ATP/GTP hydrolase [Aphanothece sacrum FPU1]GBF86562.1 ATP/GTP hydrolase [Aphanothece sacrum FPU3]